MKKKLILIIAAALIFSLALVSCGSEETQDGANETENTGLDGTEEDTGADLLAEIQDAGQIVIGTEGTWSPWTYHDEDGTLVGFDVELAEAIAEKLGVEAVFVEGEWDGLLTGLSAGRYDIMANGVDITEERQESYYFSDPYAYNRTAVVVRADDDRIQSMEDLDGMSTANTISSTYAAVAESYGATVTPVDDLNQTMELLLAGRIDATLNSEVTVSDYMTARPDAEIKVAVYTDDAGPIGIPLSKSREGAQTLLDAINEALAELRDEGVLSELSIKYFGIDITNE